MDYSAYVRVLLSVFVGLALGQLVQGLHRLARFRGTVRWDVLPLVWALFTLLMIVQTWWAYFDILQSELWLNIFAFMLPLAVFVLLYLLAATALPDLSKGGEADAVDMRAFYEGQRRYFFGLWAVLLALALLVSRLTRGSFSLAEDGFRLFGIVVALLLAGSERRAVHAGLTILSLVSLVGYIVLFTLRIS